MKRRPGNIPSLYAHCTYVVAVGNIPELPATSRETSVSPIGGTVEGRLHCIEIIDDVL